MTTPAPVVPGKKLDPPKRGTSKIVASTDPNMANALNYAVDAVRELQTIVNELIDEVNQLRERT